MDPERGSESGGQDHGVNDGSVAPAEITLVRCWLDVPARA
jgi:hypothetical protein